MQGKQCTIVHLNSMGGALPHLPPGGFTSIRFSSRLSLFCGSRCHLLTSFACLLFFVAGPQANVEAVLRAYLICEWAHRKGVSFQDAKVRDRKPGATHLTQALLTRTRNFRGTSLLALLTPPTHRSRSNCSGSPGPRTTAA